MDKLTGHGRPHPRLVGAVGQHYEDVDTGDVYECRLANQYSTIHGAPVGGYVWELRAKGEDVQEFFGAGGSGNITTRPEEEHKTVFLLDEGVSRIFTSTEGGTVTFDMDLSDDLYPDAVLNITLTTDAGTLNTTGVLVSSDDASEPGYVVEINDSMITDTIGVERIEYDTTDRDLTVKLYGAHNGSGLSSTWATCTITFDKTVVRNIIDPKHLPDTVFDLDFEINEDGKIILTNKDQLQKAVDNKMIIRFIGFEEASGNVIVDVFKTPFIKELFKTGKNSSGQTVGFAFGLEDFQGFELLLDPDAYERDEIIVTSASAYCPTDSIARCYATPF